MIIDSSGQVGIGTTSPANKLDVNGILQSSSVGNYLQLQQSSTEGYINMTGSGNLNFRMGSGFDTRMTVTSSGNVGIGTTSPASPLHIDYDGTAMRIVRGSAVGFLYNTGTATSSNFRIQSNGGGLDFYYGSSGAVTFTDAGSERMRIDSSGNLLVGKDVANSSVAGVQLLPEGDVGVTRDGSHALLLNRLTSDGDIALFRKDGTTVGSIGTSGGTTYIGGYQNAGLYFNGTTDFRPWNTSTQANLDNSVDLGSSSARFDDIYATNGTIQTSDANEKQDIEALSEAETRVAVAAKGLLRKFRWRSAVEEKGDEARVHFGIIAQDLQAAFEAEGLDAGDYAMFIHSTWTDEETGEERSRMGVRYSELLAFIIAAI
jgi:hypothetical protein